MTSGDYEFQEQQAMDAHNQALFAELRDREISLHNREAAKLHGRAATIRRLYAALLELQDSKRYADEVVAAYEMAANGGRKRQQMTTPCSKCEVCRDFSHHWTWTADEEFPCGYYTCKHCDATGMECMECDGTGGDDDPCPECGGEGVVQVQLVRNELEPNQKGE